MIGIEITKKLVLFVFVLMLLNLLFLSVISSKENLKEQDLEIEKTNYNIYNATELNNYRFENEIRSEDSDFSNGCNLISEAEPIQIGNSGLMNSSWPMYCHDTRHTGRSPYSTVDTCDEIWTYELTHNANGNVIIDHLDIIYFGANGLYAINPNGTLKWKYITHYLVDGGAAIDRNGIIYFGIVYGSPSCLYALYSNGTLKWKYSVGGNIFSSPAIAEDGTIYFGSGDNKIYALYPNGTKRWDFETGHVVYSSPAIGQDGTVYCGSHDTYLYALYPNNGSVKWKFKTGNWIRTGPCIADDGAIYCVSLDDYLYAIYTNGTLKWKTNVGGGTSPTIGQDGTVYAGYTKLYAIYPNNGSVKWTYDVGGTMRGGTPCNSIDGTIYVGTSDGGDIIAINPDGTEKWKKHIGTCESAPAVGIDGTVLISSSGSPDEGYFHAFGRGPFQADAEGPYYGIIEEPVQFSGKAYNGAEPYMWHWDFGDGNESDIQNPMHMYITADIYDVTLTVTDFEGNSSNDTTTATIAEEYTPISLDISKPQPGIYLMDQKVLPFITPIILGRITINVEASQIEFGIDRVELFIDGTFKANLTDAPYSWTWSDRVFLRHTITVIAYDNSGQNVSKVSTVWKFF